MSFALTHDHPQKGRRRLPLSAQEYQQSLKGTER